MKKMNLFRALLVSALLISGSIPAGAAAAKGELGRVDFPTSARSPEAQADFIRGVLLLHSFISPTLRLSSQKPRRPSPTSRWRTGARR